jgi:hypothetical protein
MIINSHMYYILYVISIINPSGWTWTDPDGPERTQSRTDPDGRTDGRTDMADGADGADRYLHNIQNRRSDLEFRDTSVSGRVRHRS